MIYTLSWLSWYTHYHDYHGVFPPVRHGTYRAVQTTGILYVMSAVHRNTAAVLRVPSKSVFYTWLRPAFKPTPWILGTKICPKCFALYVGIHLKRLIFLPRDAHAYRGLCRGKMSVCLSVCLSVTRSYSVWTITHLLKVFLPSVIEYEVTNLMDIFKWSLGS